MPAGRMVLVGRVARPHGLRGHVIVNPETDFVDERFARGRDAVDPGGRGGEQTLTVGATRALRAAGRCRVRRVSSIEDAERLAGAELRVPEDDAAAAGRRARTTSTSWSGARSRRRPASRVGEVAGSTAAPAAALLAVDGVSGARC